MAEITGIVYRGGGGTITTDDGAVHEFQSSLEGGELVITGLSSTVLALFQALSVDSDFSSVDSPGAEAVGSGGGGGGGLSFPLEAPDSAVGDLTFAPYSWETNPNSGLNWNTGTGNPRIQVASASIMEFSSSRVISTEVIQGPDGAAGGPTYSFTNATGSGVYFDTVLKFAVGGIEALALDAAAASPTSLRIEAPAGNQSNLVLKSDGGTYLGSISMSSAGFMTIEADDFTNGDKRLLLKAGGGEIFIAGDGSDVNIGGPIGLYGVTPVAQAAKISDPSGGGTVDAESRTAIVAIVDALEGIGITAL